MQTLLPVSYTHLDVYKRQDKETHDKLFYIAEYEGRTGSGQILYLIRRCITEFEQVHGKINLEEDLRD